MVHKEEKKKTFYYYIYKQETKDCSCSIDFLLCFGVFLQLTNEEELISNLINIVASSIRSLQLPITFFFHRIKESKNKSGLANFFVSERVFEGTAPESHAMGTFDLGEGKLVLGVGGLSGGANFGEDSVELLNGGVTDGSDDVDEGRVEGEVDDEVLFFGAGRHLFLF